jgi:pilus assembly protein Flp/PilA
LKTLAAELACYLRVVSASRSAATEEVFTMMQVFKDFLADETGATAIEYGLIAAGISLAIIAAVNGIGTKLNARFTSINTSLK